jgi:hypothetical protein
MRVRVGQPHLATELKEALDDAGCVSVEIDDGGLAVAHPHANDPREETIELTFFLRAWEAARPAAKLEFEA